MAKVLSCRDVGIECDYVACGETDDEVMLKAAEHARKDHSIAEMPPEVEQKARAAIHEENVECR